MLEAGSDFARPVLSRPLLSIGIGKGCQVTTTPCLYWLSPIQSLLSLTSLLSLPSPPSSLDAHLVLTSDAGREYPCVQIRFHSVHGMTRRRQPCHESLVGHCFAVRPGIRASNHCQSCSRVGTCKDKIYCMRACTRLRVSGGWYL